MEELIRKTLLNLKIEYTLFWGGAFDNRFIG